MTITFLQPDGVAITAQQDRQGNAARNGGGAGRPLGGRSGFRVDTASTILTASSTTWTLTPCSAMIDPGAATHQGMYGWASDANVTGAVTAADATYARKDIVYIQVDDSSSGDGSGGLTANVLYDDGTPAASPVAPTLPARSFLVGTITVPQTGGGSPTAVLNPERFVSAGGVLPVYSQAERDALTAYDGLQVQRRDLSGVPTETRTAGVWRKDYSDTGWITVPKLNSFTNYTASSDWAGLRYRVINGTVYINGAVTNASAWVVNSVCGAMPAAYWPNGRVQGINVQVDPTAGYLILAVSGAANAAVSINATYPVA